MTWARCHTYTVSARDPSVRTMSRRWPPRPPATVPISTITSTTTTGISTTTMAVRRRRPAGRNISISCCRTSRRPRKSGHPGRRLASRRSRPARRLPATDVGVWRTCWPASRWDCSSATRSAGLTTAFGCTPVAATTPLPVGRPCDRYVTRRRRRRRRFIRRPTTTRLLTAWIRRLRRRRAAVRRNPCCSSAWWRPNGIWTPGRPRCTGPGLAECPAAWCFTRRKRRFGLRERPTSRSSGCPPSTTRTRRKRNRFWCCSTCGTTMATRTSGSCEPTTTCTSGPTVWPRCSGLSTAGSRCSSDRPAAANRKSSGCSASSLTRISVWAARAWSWAAKPWPGWCRTSNTASRTCSLRTKTSNSAGACKSTRACRARGLMR